METESFTIVNENEHDIVGQIQREKKAGKSPCVIFSPGVLDTAKTPYIKALSKKFLENGWVVVLFDMTNSFGESGGRSEDVTITQRIDDLEKVVNYAKRRSFVNDKKITVIGHCYGGMTALAMEGFKHILAAMAIISVPARIEETKLTRKSSHEMMKIKLKRYFHVHHDTTGEEVRINYAFLEDGIKIDMDRASRNLDTPTIFFHGAKDDSIPLANTERMHNKAIGKKELVVIPSMEHEVKGAAITKIYKETVAFFDKVL